MSLGNNGDLYIDRETGDYYAKIDGVWVLQGNITGPQGIQGGQGVQGVPGLPGTPGAVVITSDILFGAGAPSDGLGSDGEVYVDTDVDDVYKKIAGHWELQTNLHGANGANFLTGNGVPDPGLGFDGDTYLDGLTGDVYAKESGGVWIATGGNLRGPQGNPGTSGAAGAPGAAGTRGSLWFTGAGAPGVIGGQANADKYLDSVTGDVYSLIAGTWTYQFTITGTPGTPGTPGADGSRFLSGSGTPSGGTGSNGDTYLKTSTGDIYGPKSGGSWGAPVANIQGAPGTPGAPGDPGDPGTPGAAGARGSLWFTGSTVPLGLSGEADGDFYLRSTNSEIYKLIAGVWTDQGYSIKGLQGDPGTTGVAGASFLSGAGAPSGGIGSNGDTYLNATNGDVYGPKSGGSWGAITGNLKGPQGNPGADGAGSGGSTQLRMTMTYSSTTTDSDPGTGIFRFDSATIASITKMYFDLSDTTPTDNTTALDALLMSDRTRSLVCRIYDASTPPKFITLRITGRTTATGYRKFDVVVIGGPATFNLANAANYTVQFDFEDVDRPAMPPPGLNLLGYKLGLPGWKFTPTSYDGFSLTADTCYIRLFRITKPTYVNKLHWMVKQSATTKTVRWLIYRVKHIGQDANSIVFGANVYNSGTQTADWITTATARNRSVGVLLEPGTYAVCLASGGAHTGNLPIAYSLMASIDDSMVAPSSNNVNWRVAADMYISADKCTTLEDPLTGTVTVDYVAPAVASLTGFIVPFLLEYWEL